MHLLVTRPLEQSITTARKLQDMGHTVQIEPLLQVDGLQSPPPQGSFNGVILTSSNAVAALDQHWSAGSRGTIPVLVTGTATRAAVQAAGFTNTTSVDGSAADLVKRCPNWMKGFDWPQPVNLLYPGAETLAQDIVKELSNLDIRCTHWPVYRTVTAKKLNDGVAHSLRQHRIDLTLLYSSRTASAFARLLQQHHISAPSVATAVLSSQIAASLPLAMRSNCRIAKQPREESLFDLLV